MYGLFIMRLDTLAVVIVDFDGLLQYISHTSPVSTDCQLTSGLVLLVLHVPVLSIASGFGRFDSRRFCRLFLIVFWNACRKKYCLTSNVTDETKHYGSIVARYSETTVRKRWTHQTSTDKQHEEQCLLACIEQTKIDGSKTSCGGSANS